MRQTGPENPMKTLGSLDFSPLSPGVDAAGRCSCPAQFWRLWGFDLCGVSGPGQGDQELRGFFWGANRHLFRRTELGFGPQKPESWTKDHDYLETKRIACFSKKNCKETCFVHIPNMFFSWGRSACSAWSAGGCYCRGPRAGSAQTAQWLWRLEEEGTGEEAAWRWNPWISRWNPVGWNMLKCAKLIQMTLTVIGINQQFWGYQA